MPPFAWWRVKRIVQADLGPIEDRFTELDHKPVAAASVAQVHRGRLKDGREVAVKVLRPSVRRQVERDAVIMLGFARLIALHPKLRLSDPVGHTKEFVDAIHDQTDLEIEAANYRRFRENFTGWTRATFPSMYTEHSSKRVLTMEFIRGTKVDSLPAGDHKVLAETVKLVMFKMCFDDGFLHADMHPGNMMVVEDGTLVVFDVGLAKQLHEDVLIQFIDMSKCMAMGNPEDLVNHLKRFHRYLGGVDWDAIGRDVSAFAEKFRGQDTRTLDYGKLFNEMFAIGRKYKVQPVTDMAMVLVALVTVQGIGKMLNPDDNAFADVARYLIPVLMRRNEKVPDSDAARAAQATA
jgi:ubiquinone biosynthesis protein